MKRFLVGIALVGLLASTAQAQLAVFPTWYNSTGSGVGIFAMFGMGLNSDAQYADDASNPAAFGGMVTVNAGVFKAWGGANYVDPKVTGLDKEVTFGGNLGVGLYKQQSASPVYVDLMVGVGYAKFGDAVTGQITQMQFPIAIPIAVALEVSEGYTLAPWFAPGLQIFNTKFSDAAGDTSETNLGFGVAGGLNFQSTMGLSLFVVGDWSTATIGGVKNKPFRIGAGIGYSFNVSSFGESKGLFGN